MTLIFNVVPMPTGECLHQLIEQQVERTPEAIAVTYDKTSLTYQPDLLPTQVGVMNTQQGICNSFFDSGGHSLLATRAVSRLRQMFCRRAAFAHLLCDSHRGRTGQAARAGKATEGGRVR